MLKLRTGQLEMGQPVLGQPETYPPEAGQPETAQMRADQGGSEKPTLDQRVLSFLPRSGPMRRVLPGGSPAMPAATAPTRRPHLAVLGLAIEGPVPLPRAYRPGTLGFRYWAAAERLERVAGMWQAAADGRLPWAQADMLHIHLAGGRARGALYERGRLVLGGAAAPAELARALGPAVLDALRPDLWHVAGCEVAAFHAGFAEAAALLAELDAPDAGAARRPAQTPFGLAFAEVLAVLAEAGTSARRPARAADARLVALRGARLLVEAVRRAAVTPDFASQVGAEMALAATVREGPLVALLLRELFARHGLVPRSAALEGYDPHAAEDGTELPAAPPVLPWVAMDAAALGLDRPLLVCPPSQPPLLSVTENAPAPLADARAFAAALAAQGLMEKPRIGRLQRRAPGARGLATHRLVDDGRVLRLLRERVVVGP